MSEDKKIISNSEDEEQEKIIVRFSDIWKGILKFWWLVLLLGVIVSLGLFIFKYSKFRPQYKATATFTVNTETMSLTGEGLPSYSYYYDNATASNLADTFPYILSSNILTEAICDDLDISYVPASLSAEAVSSTNMFTLTAVGSDAKMTYDVLVSAMKNYPDAAKYLVGNVQLTMITEPQIPTEPVNKFSYTVLLKGFGTGFVLGAVWIFLYAVLRKTIKTKSDVTKKLKIEVIGTLPEVTFKKYKNGEIDRSILIRNERIGKGFLEAVRVYKNSFIHLVKHEEKVIMATSTAPGEGKTTAVVNLALSLADSGNRVLVVDADMRNPSVAAVLGLDMENLKASKEDELYSLYEVENFGISLLTLKHEDHSYWKAMNTEFLKGLFDSFRDEYDYILVDTPPCGLVADTALIAESCDAIIYVVLQDTVRINKILSGIDSVSHTDTRIMGVVMNGAQSGLSGYGDNYGYGYGGYGHYKSYSKYGYVYGYVYGYGYGNGYGQQNKKGHGKGKSVIDKLKKDKTK